ncbi:MAG: hypothetical protein LUC33_07110, partial [Prevotellaceae bacterium]|nr:hypothetical protein [Prevotellaceae bacterium]
RARLQREFEAALPSQVDEMEKRIETLSRAEREAWQADTEGRKLSERVQLAVTIPGAMGSGGSVLYGEGRTGALRDAEKHLSNARRIMAEAARNTSPDALESSFKAGAWRGLRDAVTDPDTWDMGTRQLLESSEMLAIVGKLDRGEALDGKEQALLDAAALDAAVSAAYSPQLGRGYGAGEVTGQSLPFMFEMMLNPLSEAGEAGTRKLAEIVGKRYGKWVLSTLGERWKSYVVKSAKFLTRQTLNSLTSGGMAVTSGMVRTGSDIAGRHIGNVTWHGGERQVVTGADGQRHGVVTPVEYGGRENMSGWGGAVKDALLSQAIEYWSEMVGEEFGPLTRYLGKGIGKGLDGIGLEGVTRAVMGISRNDFARGVKRFLGKAQWHGTLGEYMEEVVGNLANAILVGDETLDSDPETGVFNLDRNIDTFLGVGLMGGFTSSLQTAGYVAERHITSGAIDRTDDKAAGLFRGREGAWENYARVLRDGTDGEAVDAVRKMLGDRTLTGAQHRLALERAYLEMRRRGSDEADAKMRETVGEAYERASASLSDDHARGAALASDGDAAGCSKAFDTLRYLRAKVLSLAGQEELDRLDSDPLRVVTEASARGEGERLDLYRQYVSARQVVTGILTSIKEAREDALSALDLDLDKREHTGADGGKDGTVAHAMLVTGERVAVVDDRRRAEGVVYVVGEDGLARQIAASDLDPQANVEIESRKDIRKREAARIDAESKSRQDGLLGALAFNPGDEYTKTGEDGHTPEKIRILGPAVAAEGETVPQGSVSVEREDGTVENMNAGYVSSHAADARLGQAAMSDEAARMALEGLIERLTPHTVSAATRKGRYKHGDRVLLSDGQGGYTEGTVTLADYGKGLIRVDTGEAYSRKAYRDFSPEELEKALYKEGAADEAGAD